ncbi:MAG TPA: MOSC N-terminal beta barrel domain-containing protein [Opitutaceae bacterium]|nr:MOSC N-terminal beta barrel domain-containing protein [Opitutaceae bacterium]
MHLSALYVYPVKSLRGFAVTESAVDDLGLAGDRRFMLIDETGRFLTQRALPRMALIATALAAGQLTLSAQGAGSVTVATAPDPAAPLRNVSVWKSEGLLAEDCGEAPARWLSAFLQAKIRLVRIGAKFMRPVLKQVAGPGDRVSFADSVPFLILTEASLVDLNDRLVAQGGEALPMDRFRPNLVVAGATAFAEDSWARFRIGGLTFHAAGPCTRCTITTTNQQTAERGKEPLRTLATYRRDAEDPTDVIFGQNVVHETKAGKLRVGDKVDIS